MNDENTSELIYGRNAVIEVIRSGTQINKVLIAKQDNTGSMKKIIAMLHDNNIMYQFTDKSVISQATGSESHQGVCAYISPAVYCEPEDILKAAEDKGEPPFIIIADELQDPRNLGAIIRTCDAVGAHGVIIPKRHGTAVTGTVAKTSAGATAYVPVARVSNIPATIDMLKEKGVWIYGTSADSTAVFSDTDFKGAVGLVIGNEGSGMGNLVSKKCDFMLSIPMCGHVTSLNASVAASLVMYEVYRQRRSGANG